MIPKLVFHFDSWSSFKHLEKIKTRVNSDNFTYSKPKTLVYNIFINTSYINVVRDMYMFLVRYVVCCGLLCCVGMCDQKPCPTESVNPYKTSFNRESWAYTSYNCWIMYPACILLLPNEHSLRLPHPWQT